MTKHLFLRMSSFVAKPQCKGQSTNIFMSHGDLLSTLSVSPRLCLFAVSLWMILINMNLIQVVLGEEFSSILYLSIDLCGSYTHWPTLSNNFKSISVISVQFSSVAQSCLTLCDPMNRSTPGLPVHHHLPEFTQTHVHRVGDAIQPSHPLSSPFPPAPNPSQHQSLFQ